MPTPADMIDRDELTLGQKLLLALLGLLAFLAFYWMTVDAMDWQWERYEEEAAEFRESLAAQGISWPASQQEEAQYEIDRQAAENWGE